MTSSDPRSGHRRDGRPSPLAGLSPEQLVQHVRSRVDVSSESFYQRQPGVPAARIAPYPRRRRALGEARLPRVGDTTPAAEPCYADFLGQPSHQHQHQHQHRASA